MATILPEIDTASQIIYLDHAATTPVRSEVLDAMLPYFSEAFGNPSSLYAIAGESRNAIDEARARVASVLNCRTSEVVFTGGGTEADNMAVKGVASTFDEPGDIIISEIEHHAIIHAAEQLEKDGHRVIIVPVDRYGVVDSDDVRSRLGDRDAVVSIMFANNEVGAVNDIPEIAGVAKQHGREAGTNVVVHTDAVQASGKLGLDVKMLGIDLLSLSAHKIHGPKGVGALYVRRGVKLEALIAGGGQERQRRSGTENVPGIVGMGMALALAENERMQFCERTRGLRDRFLAAVTERISGVVVNNHPENSLPHIAHISITWARRRTDAARSRFQGCMRLQRQRMQFRVRRTISRPAWHGYDPRASRRKSQIFLRQRFNSRTRRLRSQRIGRRRRTTARHASNEVLTSIFPPHRYVYLIPRLPLVGDRTEPWP